MTRGCCLRAPSLPRVAQRMSTTINRQFAHAVVNNEPAMSSENGWRTCANLESLPRRHWSCQPVMRSKLRKAIRARLFQAARQYEIQMLSRRDPPDAFQGSARSPSAVYLQTVGDGACQVQFSSRVRYRDRKKARIFIIYVRQFDTVQ